MHSDAVILAEVAELPRLSGVRSWKRLVGRIGHRRSACATMLGVMPATQSIIIV